jgi:hypothetical protein
MDAQLDGCSATDGHHPNQSFNAFGTLFFHAQQLQRSGAKEPAVKCNALILKVKYWKIIVTRFFGAGGKSPRRVFPGRKRGGGSGANY